MSNAEFDLGTRIGMSFMVGAFAASALAVTGLLLYIAYSAFAIQRNASRRWSTETHVHYYFLNLLLCDLILSVGGLLNIKWIIEAGVYPGALCTVQGGLRQIGAVGVALSTMAIALHILQILALRWRSPPKFALVVLAIIWLVIFVLSVVPNIVQRNIYGPTGYWCWIERSMMEQIGLECIWLWLAVVLNVTAYMFLGLVVKRWKEKRKSTFICSDAPMWEEQIKADQMFFCPLVYIVVVLPISGARFSALRGNAVPFPVIASADVLFALSGLFGLVCSHPPKPHTTKSPAWCAFSASSPFYLCGKDRKPTGIPRAALGQCPPLKEAT
ncbi:hypothetical protein SCLCIDRAFT_855764 [Scleroderma citrinum Foug A]|uniref:Glucose receptor Git3 N-terminal domain-containing protein n=1 Tax=Scleroderma citrinum Foug A TaxID=1036808 RepID=A0A0C3DZX9_9AGAM|nr:hypothetical protein SCLCIDRAFT_855764 [Scleroderma citrinum Foug A]